MVVTFEKAKNTLATLPIGYYLGKGINYALDEKGSDSYYSPTESKIVVSYPTIAETLKDIPEDETMTEKALRCILYHEISHVILTPKSLFEDAFDWLYYTESNRMVKDIFNVFEDERIETILRGYYLGVNFKWFVKLLNKWSHEKEKDIDTAFKLFYAIVRFDFNAYPEFVERKNKIIKDFPDIYKSRSIRYQYVSSVWQLWEDIKAKMKESSEPPKEPKEPKDGEPIEGETGDGNPIKGEPKEPKDGEPKEPKDGEPIEGEPDGETEGEPDDEPEEKNPLSTEEIKDILNKAIHSSVLKYDDPKIKSALGILINQSINKQARMSGSSTGYTGKFDERALAKDLSGTAKSYKWFIHEDTKGTLRRFSKIKLNFFVDVSGSFRSSEDKINQIIKALVDLESKIPDFELDIIKMGMKNELAPKKERFVKCNGGNWLTNDIIDIYKKVQSPNAVNVNLVVFDGDAQSFEGGHTRALREENVKAFTAWNHPNCAIVSDYSNKTYFETAKVTQAKITYTSHYVEELEKNIYKMLGVLLK